MILLSNFAACGDKNRDFSKKKEASGLLSTLGLKAPLSKLPVLGNIFLKV